MAAPTGITEADLEFDHGTWDATGFARTALASWQTLARVIDHTLLRADATLHQVENLCDEAARYRFACATVNPMWVPTAVSLLAGTGIPVGTAIGFPLGAALDSTLRQEAAALTRLGAKELEMVIPVGQLKSGNHSAVRRSMHTTATVAHHHGAILKVILETSLLNVEEKLRGAEIPVHGEKARMRGWVRFGGQSPRPLTPTLSPRSPGQEPGEGEGVMRRRARLDFSGRGINLFNGFRRIFRARVRPRERKILIVRRRPFGPADERPAIGDGLFGGRSERVRLEAAPAGDGGKPMIAVELAHDFDHLVDRLEVGQRHGAVGDQQRLVQPARLDRHEFLRRMRHAAVEDVSDHGVHALLAQPHLRRDLGHRHAAIEVFDDALFPLEFRQPRGARVGRPRRGGGGKGGVERGEHGGLHCEGR